jgi:hypothetical protein
MSPVAIAHHDDQLKTGRHGGSEQTSKNRCETLDVLFFTLSRRANSVVTDTGITRPDH